MATFSKNRTRIVGLGVLIAMVSSGGYFLWKFRDTVVFESQVERHLEDIRILDSLTIPLIAFQEIDLSGALEKIIAESNRREDSGGKPWNFEIVENPEERFGLFRPENLREEQGEPVSGFATGKITLTMENCPVPEIVGYCVKLSGGGQFAVRDRTIVVFPGDGNSDLGPMVRRREPMPIDSTLIPADVSHGKVDIHEAYRRDRSSTGFASYENLRHDRLFRRVGRGQMIYDPASQTVQLALPFDVYCEFHRRGFFREPPSRWDQFRGWLRDVTGMKPPPPPGPFGVP